MHRITAIPTLIALALVSWGFGSCGSSADGPDESDDFDPGWEDDDGFFDDDDDIPGGAGESTTGTFLDPLDRASGYQALDETCEQRDDPDYLGRLETPMFRDAVAVDDMVHLVDGSLLWTLSLADPAEPERRSLTRLPGHPLALAALPSGLLAVAAGEAGLLVVSPEEEHGGAPVVASLDLPGPALDVVVAEETSASLCFVALGADGMAVVDVSVPQVPRMLAVADVSGFANALAVQQGTLYAATCEALSIVDVADPRAPFQIAAYQVPEGHAKGVAVDGTDLFVAGGEALFAFDVSDPLNVRWSGYYTDEAAEGFYVNGVVTRDGVAWIAAGDESVRAVDVSDLSEAAVWLPPAGDGDPPGLDDVTALPDPSIGTGSTAHCDPIEVVLARDLLLVLGNFRWVGERMLRVMDVSTGSAMVHVGVYEQPDLTVGVDVLDSGLLLHLDGGQESLIGPDGSTISGWTLPATVRESAVEKDDAALLLEGGDLYWRDPAGVRLLAQGPFYDVTRSGDRLFVADGKHDAVAELDPYADDPSLRLWTLYLDTALLGFARLAWHAGTLYAYDWIMGTLHAIDASGSGLHGAVGVGLCETWDLADFYDGTSDVASRLFVDGDTLLLFCPRDDDGDASLRSYDLSEPLLPAPMAAMQLDSGRWRDVAVVDGVVYGLAFDNGTYGSAVGSFDGEGWKTIAFDGHANGFRVTDREIVVADGDFGLRRFALASGGSLDVGGSTEGR